MAKLMKMHPKFVNVHPKSSKKRLKIAPKPSSGVSGTPLWAFLEPKRSPKWHQSHRGAPPGRVPSTGRSKGTERYRIIGLLGTEMDHEISENLNFYIKSPSKCGKHRSKRGCRENTKCSSIFYDFKMGLLEVRNPPKCCIYKHFGGFRRLRRRSEKSKKRGRDGWQIFQKSMLGRLGAGIFCDFDKFLELPKTMSK